MTDQPLDFAAESVHCEQCSQMLTKVGEELSERDFVLCPSCGNMQSQLATVDKVMAGEVAYQSVPFQSSRYRFGEILGQGSFGVVYRAEDLELRRNVAIKAAYGALRGKEATFFIREARAASRLRHPNIVTVHDVVRDGDRVFIVSDLVEGKALRSWLDTQRLAIDESVKLAMTLCDAMEYAHQNGIVHRDLKPGNIVVDVRGEPHILDFGLSQSIDNSLETISVDGTPIGTPAFMSPEQVRGERKALDARTDIYSIGVILYQLLSGRLPFSGERTELYRLILEESPPSLTKFVPKISKSLDAICLKALHKEPDGRYQHAAEMKADLNRYLNGEWVQAYGRLDRRVVKNVVRRRGLIAVALSLAGFGVWAGYTLYADRMAANPLVTYLVNSEPPGAELVWQRIDERIGVVEDQPGIQSIAGEPVKLAPGYYQVTANLGGEFVEVFRSVPPDSESALVLNSNFCSTQIQWSHRSCYPEDGVIHGNTITVKPLSENQNGMVFVPAGTFQYPRGMLVPGRFAGQSEKIESLLMLSHEVTWAEMQSVWPELTIPENAEPADAATNVPWDVAMAYAERQGGRLPTVSELHYVATNGGKTERPNGALTTAESPEEFVPGVVAEWDATQSEPPIRGLLTGYDEWTVSPVVSATNEGGKISEVPFGVEDAGFAMQFPSRVYAISNEQLEKSPAAGVVSGLRHTHTLFTNNNTSFRIVRSLKK